MSAALAGSVEVKAMRIRRDSSSGVDREPLEEPLEQRGGLAALADFEEARVRRFLALHLLGRQRVGAVDAGPGAGE